MFLGSKFDFLGVQIHFLGPTFEIFVGKKFSFGGQNLGKQINLLGLNNFFEGHLLFFVGSEL